MRVVVSAAQWTSGLVEADFVIVDLDGPPGEDWMERVREGAELIGRSSAGADERSVAMALDLDVDFLAVPGHAEGVDPKKLPLRLIVEQPVGEDGRWPGAAWARYVSGWGPQDAERLTELARRERIILGAGASLPDPAWLARVGPFAVAVPDGTDPVAFERIRAL